MCHSLHTCDGAMHLGAILQFYGYGLMTKLHQKPEEETKSV